MRRRSLNERLNFLGMRLLLYVNVMYVKLMRGKDVKSVD